jgi:hypothetical protein
MFKRINLEGTSEREKFFPVEAFFNEIDDFHFVDAVGCLINGVSYGIDVANHCKFPSGLDDYDRYVIRHGKPLEGIEFSLFEDAVVLDVPTFRRFLTMACDAYVKKHPEDRAKIEELLARPQPPLFDAATGGAD